MQMEPPPPGSLPSFHLYPTQANAASLTFHRTVAALDKRAGPLLQVPRALLIAQKRGALPVMCTGGEHGGKCSPFWVMETLPRNDCWESALYYTSLERHSVSFPFERERGSKRPYAFHQAT